MKKTTFFLKKIKKDDSVIWVDEAGRGAWAGPVVAACVAWRWANPIKNILRDSKKMTQKEREKTYDEILDLAHREKLCYWIGIIDGTTIDTVGIREANRLAMSTALSQLQSHPQERLLVDGRDNYVFDIPDLPPPEYIIWGDSLVPQIMAASVIAKVTRDRIMTEYEEKIVGYGFARHKGYGTEIHQKALKKLWVCEIHRTSYAPIKLASSGKSL